MSNPIQNAKTFPGTVANLLYALKRPSVAATLVAVVLLVMLGSSANPSQAGLENEHDENMALLYQMHLKHLQRTDKVSHSAAASSPVESSSANVNSLAAPCPAWSVMAGPDAQGGADVLLGVSAISANDVWAVGYTVVNGLAQTLTQHWDGTAWTIVPSPNPGPPNNYLNAVDAVSSDNVWAVGDAGDPNFPQAIMLHWNGREWSPASLPPLKEEGSALYGVAAVSANDIWAVGYTGDIATRPQPLLLHYDGAEWQNYGEVPAGNVSVLYGISAISTDDIWAVGTTLGDRTFQTLALHWDGKSWDTIEHPVETARGNTLWSVTAITANNVWAVGHKCGDLNCEFNPTVIEHWNGTWWLRYSKAPNGGSDDNKLLGIAALSDKEIWAVGYGNTGGARRVLIIRWDGKEWAPFPAPDTGEQQVLRGITGVPGGEFVAVGQTGSKALIERYSDPCSSPPSTPTPTPAPIATPAQAAGTPAAPTVAPTVPAVPIPGTGTRTFPETGKSASGLFLEYWDAHGGLPQQGYPISGVFGEVSDLNGQPYTVQYYERAVFEYHPENQPPFNVLLSQLGTFQYKRKYKDGAPNQQPNTSAGSALFPETGKRVGGKFLAYWREHGGLAQQGLPISEEFMEKSDLDGKEYLVQYFERAVFEYHPDNAPPYDVLLSQLGTFQYKRKYGDK